MGFIYCITSPSGKKYMGQTIGTVEERLRQHKKKSSNCTLLKRAAKKYGWDNMRTQTLIKCSNKQLDKIEKEYIKLYNSLAPAGYNCTTGGETKKQYSDFTRKKISDSMKKLWNFIFQRMN